MNFSTELSERWQTARSTGGKLVGFAIVVVTGLGLYDAFISQVLPEPYKSFLPKFYEVVQMTASTLSPSQWLFLIAVCYLFAAFEHVHRNKFAKESVTPVINLTLTTIVVIILAYQQSKTDNEVGTTLTHNVSPLILQDNRIPELEARLLDTQKSVLDLKTMLDEYMVFLSHKTKLRRADEQSTMIKSAIDNLYNSNCSDLNINKDTYVQFSRMRRNYWDQNFLPPVLDTLQKEMGQTNIIPDNIREVHDNYLNALSQTPNDTANNSDYIYARGRYKDACDQLKRNINSFEASFGRYKSEIQNKITVYENENGL